MTAMLILRPNPYRDEVEVQVVGSYQALAPLSLMVLTTLMPILSPHKLVLTLSAKLRIAAA
jgi:hypothetical protein